MKKGVVLALLVVMLLPSCYTKAEKLSEFPLEKGTSWVYSYKAYEPSASNLRQTVKADYRLTEEVIETKTSSSYFIAHVTYEYELIKADNEWRGLFVEGQPSEAWYVVNGQKIFESRQTVDVKNVDRTRLILDYDFPLAAHKAWCQDEPCNGVGWRSVESYSSYETRAGKFDDCFGMLDHYNGGSLFQEFCNGVGIVSMKFDHFGTSYGFEQTLIDFSMGSSR